MSTDTATKKLSLCWGSMEELGFRDLVETASAAGFSAVTLNPPMYEDARAGGLSDADIRQLLDDNGIVVSGVDPLFSWLPGAERLAGDDPMSRLTHATTEDVFHIAQVVGTDVINAPLGFTTPDSMQQVVDSFGALCDAAQPLGLRVTLEFMPFTAVPDLATACDVIGAANRTNGGLMFDCWHHHRSGGTPADVLAIERGKVFALQLDDASAQPRDDIVEETLNHRLLPGEGVIDLVTTLRHLEAGGHSFLYDVEVFKDSLRGLERAERARLLFESAASIVRQLDA